MSGHIVRHIEGEGPGVAFDLGDGAEDVLAWLKEKGLPLLGIDPFDPPTPQHAPRHKRGVHHLTMRSGYFYAGYVVFDRPQDDELIVEFMLRWVG